MGSHQGRYSKSLPKSFRIISSCIKAVSKNATTAVRSASASVASSISSSGDDRKEHVLWAGFDKLELSPTAFRRVLLLGYLNGFQVFDVEEAASLSELVSRRDGPVTFLQMLPAPASNDGTGKYKSSHPMVVVAGGYVAEKVPSFKYTGLGHVGYSSPDSSFVSSFDPPTAVRFYSMKSNEYVKAIDFRSPVFMVRCSPRVVAIGLEEQIYCFDTLTLEKRFTVVTHPVPRLGEPGAIGINTGYGPMSVGSRWLAYPPNRPFLVNTGRVSPKNVTSSVSPSTSPGSGTMMARYAVESSKHLAAGLLTLGDMGYKKLSKFYPDLLLDSPDSPGRKTGKLVASEPENAGVVALKDLACSEIISQFRAHTSPISALCFDPSGTLLVTASIHGNSINIFRIMPCHKCGEHSSGKWGTSYVHLYKLYRGITSAVIQDICFNQYGQWIAVVSSRGTCHIFVLSPFGGNDVLQTLHAHGQGGASQFLASTTPWWSTSSFTVNEQHSLPPPTCTLSVVTRIKCNDSGLLNSVSNAASSIVGKSWVPSGALAAVFHNSNSTFSADVKSRGTSLEHILVYTPSGFVVQHEIILPLGFEMTGTQTECLASPQANAHNEELRVKVEALQWWEVCRRLDNMEREDSIALRNNDGTNDPEIGDGSKMIFQDNVSARDKKLAKATSLKSPDSSYLYLSNAEVQMYSCRYPIWQKSMMHFHVLESPRTEYCSDGEFEIEVASSREIEVKHKSLLPVFENFRRVQHRWVDGSTHTEEKYPGVSSQARAEAKKFHLEVASSSYTKSPGGGSSGHIENLLDLNRKSIDRSPIHGSHDMSDLNRVRSENIRLKVASVDQRSKAGSRSVVEENSDDNSTTSRPSSLPDDIPLPNADSNVVMSSRNQENANSGQLRKEGYCNKLDFHDHHLSAETMTNKMDSNGKGDKEIKPEEEEEGEGWLGDMFYLSEEG